SSRTANKASDKIPSGPQPIILSILLNQICYAPCSKIATLPLLNFSKRHEHTICLKNQVRIRISDYYQVAFENTDPAARILLQAFTGGREGPVPADISAL